ncbi:hypothetical protein CRENBAI_010935 [Crenichthys baileyi]|uniref:Uncharacterized protein n=1 Tax=Crenichthys baileyi TaxID=28760 RepID=A0AAV9SSR5_9TELE
MVHSNQRRFPAVTRVWKAEQRCRRRRLWVHHIPQRLNHFGEYHNVLQEQCLDDGCFQQYFRLDPPILDPSSITTRGISQLSSWQLWTQDTSSVSSMSGGYGRTSDCGILANSAFSQALRAGTLSLPPDLHLP